MKMLLFSISMFCFASAVCQTPYYDFKKYQNQKKLPSLWEKNITKELSLSKILDLKYSYNYLKPAAKLLFTLENGSKIYSLPQDNMICLVPDMSPYNMPNIAKGKKVSGMPPGFVPPYNIIPEK